MYDRTHAHVRTDRRQPTLTELQAAAAEEIEDAQRRIYENAQRHAAPGHVAVPKIA
jgi:hypothetical protein